MPRVLRFYEQSTGDDQVIGAAKEKTLFDIDKKGTILGIYFNTTNRDVRLIAKWDGKNSIEFPSNTELNTMGLNQAAGYTHGALKIQEFYSTSPFGLACEFPIEFDYIELSISNQSSSAATIAPFWVWWEETLP